MAQYLTHRFTLTLGPGRTRPILWRHLRISLALVSLGLATSLWSRTWGWLAVAGAAVTIQGLVISAQGFRKLGAATVSAPPAPLAPSGVLSTEVSEEMLQRAVEQFSTYVGLWLTVAGTIVGVLPFLLDRVPPLYLGRTDGVIVQMRVWWASVSGWLSNHGAALPGIIGTIIAIAAYQRAGRIKALDLRVELRKAEADFRRVVESLSPSMEYANRSRIAAMAAQGLTRSGAELGWQADLRADQEHAQALAADVAPSPLDYAGASLKAMEDRLVTLHELIRRAEGVAAKYAETVAADVRYQEQRRAEINHIGVR